MHLNIIESIIVDILLQIKHKTSILQSVSKFNKKQACCASPKGKIHPFSKIAVTFEQVVRFGCPLRFRISLKDSVFYDWKPHIQPLGPGGAVKIFSQTVTESIND